MKVIEVKEILVEDDVYVALEDLLHRQQHFSGEVCTSV